MRHIRLIILALLAIVVGQEAMAVNKTVTYTFTAERDGSTNRWTLTFTPSGDQFGTSGGAKTVTINDITNKNSLANSEWMLRAVKSVREITNDTKAEIYEVAAEPGVNYIKRLGLDMVEGVADDVDKVAATTACLFFGFLDGATTISESYGGGGGNNELPKKKDNEDDLSFARRCHQMVKAMHAPRYRLRRG